MKKGPVTSRPLRASSRLGRSWHAKLLLIETKSRTESPEDEAKSHEIPLPDSGTTVS